MEKYSELRCSFKEDAKCTGKEKFIRCHVFGHEIVLDQIDFEVKRCIDQEAYIAKKVDDIPKFIKVSDFTLSEDLDQVAKIKNRIYTEKHFDEPFIVSFGLYMIHYEA